MIRTTIAAWPVAGAASRHSKWATLVVLALTQLMVVLDTTIVTVALPSIQRALRFSSAADLQWVVNAYVLAAGGFLLLGGRVADRYGRRRVFVAGTAVFAVGSLVGGLSNSAIVLVTSRAVQGLGAAFMGPAALSLLIITFTEGDERNRALGIWAAIAGAGGAIGLLAGGLLTTALSWRWVFFVNIPIATLAVGASYRLIEESRDLSAVKFDVLGAVTGTAGLGTFVFALVRGGGWGWGSLSTLSVLVSAVVLLGVFVVVQVRSRHPLVPPRLFRSRVLLGADVGILIAGAGLFAMFLFLTLYFQEVLHYSPLKTGVAYLPISAMIVASAGVGARILSRVGARPIVVCGFLSAAVGLGLLVRISPATGYADVLPSLLLIGGGVGAAFVSITSSAVSGVRPEDSGVASALLNASQQIGGALGLAVLTAVATARFEAVRPLRPTPGALAAASTSSWAYAFSVGATLLVVAAVVTAWLFRVRPKPPGSGEKPGTDLSQSGMYPVRPTLSGDRAPLSPVTLVCEMARSGCHG